jgi:hypothetical protein
MQNAQNEIEKDIDPQQLYQTKRLLGRIEALYLTCEFTEELSALIKRYFYTKYNNSSKKFIRITIIGFQKDLLLTQCSCTADDVLEIGNLYNDISSTFELIITKTGDYRTFFEKIKKFSSKFNSSDISFELEKGN